MIIKVKGSNNIDIAESRICIFENNINYIQSFEVSEEFQGKKVGSLFFKYIVEDIIPVNRNTIYIKPTSKGMKIICKKYKFSKSDKISSWYII